MNNVAIVGAGVIGVSWSALLLSHGHRVTVNDPRPDLEQAVRDQLREIAAALPGLDPDTDALRFEPDLATAVASADVVQENGPEQLHFKQQLWRSIEQHAPAAALFATSSSGLMASAVSESMRAPGRLLVGHPFNPPHLMPLVEVVPGPATGEETVQRAVAYYTSLGKRPMVLHKEIPGFVANRLQSALFREAVHLVAQGVVTEAQLDEIVNSSIGPRWAATGPFRAFHLGGGPGGLPHFIEHLGRAMEATWPGLGNPTFDDDTVKLLIEQAQEAFGSQSVAELETDRDHREAAVLRALGLL